MKVNYRIEGGAELARQLERLEHSVSRQVQVHALKTAAEPIRAAAAVLAPHDERANAPHLDENIVIGVQTAAKLERIGRETETVVEVGPRAGASGDDFFYGLFQEFGTSDHAAQPFMRPAFDGEHREALDILMDELWWAIRRGGTVGDQF